MLFIAHNVASHGVFCRLEIVLLNVSAERATAVSEMNPPAAALPPARDTSIGRHVMNAFFHCLYSTNSNGSGSRGGGSMTQRDRNDVSRLVRTYSQKENYLSIISKNKN